MLIFLLRGQQLFLLAWLGYFLPSLGKHLLSGSFLHPLGSVPVDQLILCFPTHEWSKKSWLEASSKFSFLGLPKC